MKRFYILLTFALAAVICGCTPKENKIAVTAHRGFWTCEEAGYMENTVASLAQAQENGLWGSEFDIHITADDQILVNHDPVLGGKNIHEMPLDSFMTMTLKNGEHLGDLLIVHTPGHDSDSISLLDEKTGILFSGDSLQGRGTASSGVAFYQNREEYLYTLDTVEKLPVKKILAGHPFVQHI